MAHDAGSHSSSNTVTMRNTTRTSLSFRIPGQSVRLSPGSTIELPRSSLDSHEVKALLERSALVPIVAGAASAGAPASGAATPERKSHKRTQDK